MPIHLTDEMREHIGNAVENRMPVISASVDAEGQPSIAFYGSTQVYSDDQLAIWVRNRIPDSPRMAVLYRNPAERLGWQFHGRAHIEDDAEICQHVYDAAPEGERNADPEMQGIAVIIDVDRVIMRGEVIMSRDD
jgi:predicted pyridoxine 5'-phosphate oxidase superfamily flavin-nucleotide-binding protein